MLTLNQTASDDKSLIWLIEIILDSSTLRIAYDKAPITLSGNVYSSGKIATGSLQINSKIINITDGGGTGSKGTLSFLLRKNGYAPTDFYPDFTVYPTHKPYLSARAVKLGFVWRGATLSSQITWKESYYVDQINYSPNTTDLVCIQTVEQANLLLPAYEIQKALDDEISYFPKADESLFGQPMPIIYGDFTTYNPKINDAILAPIFLVDKTNYTFLVASHPCFLTDVNENIFKFLRGAECYMKLSTQNASNSNTIAGFKINFLPVAASVNGEVYIQFKMLGSASNVNVLSLPTLNNPTDYITLSNDPNHRCVSFVMGTDISESSLGKLRSGSADIQFIVEWESAVEGATRSVESHVAWYTGSRNNDGDSIAVAESTGVSGTHSFLLGDYTGWKTKRKSKDEDILPWKIEELQNREYTFYNMTEGDDGGSARSVKILNAYMYLNNVSVVRINPRYTSFILHGLYKRMERLLGG